MSDAINGPTPIWTCKIGILGNATMPTGADYPMREAVAKTFYELTGKHPEFCFSGWSAELTEPELAVVENRLPSEAHYVEWRAQKAAPELLVALDAMVAAWDSPKEGEAVLALNNARAAIARAKGGE